ncbi:cation channel sperm-associated protein subunit epsilon [Varanus komodoensis]|uniref:cation channel sperm-associated protein subunit epsilon n=1 Tax=Varanus komodoensis TaxID=61221 RepID=UPI001CF79584|nr:cation channel sperm-associated protein subunit epsilon [Varanus komodoensis]
MEQARCLQEAQNKALMIPESTENISRLEELWGPQNYKPCFVSEEEYSGDLHKPYEIMNHSGINSIIWPQRYSGIFMFRLIILDPNYSFCDFKVYFAVHTYGIIER